MRSYAATNVAEAQVLVNGLLETGGHGWRGLTADAECRVSTGTARDTGAGR